MPAKSTKHPNPEITLVLSKIQAKLKAAGFVTERTFSTVECEIKNGPRISVEVKYDFAARREDTQHKIDVYVQIPGFSHTAGAGDFVASIALQVQGLTLLTLAEQIRTEFGSMRWAVPE